MKKTTLVLIALAFNLSAKADNTEKTKEAVGKCASQYLFSKFIPTHGNIQLSSANMTQIDYQSASDAGSKERIVVINPGWSAFATSQGTVISDEGKVEHYEKKHMDAEAKAANEDSAIAMKYYSFVSTGSKSNEVNVILDLPTGVPYLVATQTKTVKCTVDPWGREVCESPDYNHSNFRLVMPKSYQSKIKWMNELTKQETAFEVSLENYSKCLGSIR